jgi:hypothetical protein
MILIIITCGFSNNLAPITGMIIFGKSSYGFLKQIRPMSASTKKYLLKVGPNIFLRKSTLIWKNPIDLALR